MTPTPIVLAVYGTLRRGERNHAFLAGSTFLGRGSVLGRLFEMPRSAARAYAYPALVLGGPSRVVVELYDIPDPAALAAADDLEAFDPADEAGSQYVRRVVGIVDGPVAAAWVYLYNGPPADMGEVIPDGDWVTFLARGGA
ncbi:MAG TPA: gamma-glutamylcyclotransferase family protein [Candidatus Limnocylindrales bacterium]|nr:gamma-glutamylcyclotransferase family protein [Candidatus Limnocylindrales bacterium]